MRTPRGLTVLVLAGLTVMSTSGSAMAAGPDDGPTAEAVPGSSTSLVVAPATSVEYRGEWRDAHSLSVDRGATAVELQLPDETLALPVTTTDITVLAYDGDRSVAALEWREDVLAAQAISFDLQAALRAAASRGMGTVVSLSVVVGAFPDPSVLSLWIDVDLTGGAAVAPAVIALGTPPSRVRTQAFSATAARVAPGSRLTILGWPGVFDAYSWVPSLATSDWSTSVTLPTTGWAMPDGSVMSIGMPADVASYGWLQIQTGTESDRRTVTLALVPPVTGAVEAYVTAVYNDLFGRDPDSGGLVTWTNALSTGTPYGAVADAITSSAEFRSGLIRDAYATYLGRRPDAAGLAFWLEQMRKGMHIQQMEAGFLASTEYYGYAGGTDAGWVRSLYRDVLGREPALSEVSFWVPIVRSHGRGEVAKGFLYSTERLRVDVDRYYLWLLRRGGDTLGRDGWVRAIQRGVRVEAIIAAFISSVEYRINVPAS